MLEYWNEFLAAFFRELKHLLPGQHDIAEGIRATLDFHPVFYLTLGPWNLPISSAMIGMLISMVILASVAYFLGRKPTLKPRKSQVIGEMLVETVENFGMSSGLNRAQAQRVAPYILTLFLFITTCNVSSIFGLRPPAQNPAFALTLAIFSIIYIIFMGIRLVGFKGFLRSLMQPIPALLPFNFLDYLIKPISLTFRLFGNVFGAYILMQFVHLVVPLVLPAFVGLYFDIVDGIIQGTIFTYLTLNSIGELVTKSEEGLEAAQAKQLA